MTEFVIQLNLFGPNLKNEDIKKVLSDLQYKRPETTMIENFFKISISSISKEMLERYVESTESSTHASVTPHTEEVFAKIVSPLVSAKRTYCLGEYLATIALCGLSAEALAILIWRINDVMLKGVKLSCKQEYALFGNDKGFDYLDQKRKLEVLKVFSFITKNQYDDFCFIRQVRNSNLHLLDDKMIAKDDALKVLKKTLGLFKEVIKLEFIDGGKITINPLLLKLIKKE